MFIVQAKDERVIHFNVFKKPPTVNQLLTLVTLTPHGIVIVDCPYFLNLWVCSICHCFRNLCKNVTASFGNLNAKAEAKLEPPTLGL